MNLRTRTLMAAGPIALVLVMFLIVALMNCGGLRQTQIQGGIEPIGISQHGIGAPSWNLYPGVLPPIAPQPQPTRTPYPAKPLFQQSWRQLAPPDLTPPLLPERVFRFPNGRSMGKLFWHPGRQTLARGVLKVSPSYAIHFETTDRPSEAGYFAQFRAGDLRSLSYGGAEKLDRADLVAIGRLKSLEFLSISSASGLAVDLSPLANLSNLRALSLPIASRPAVDLFPLTNLSNLRVLSLRIESIDDETLRLLGAIPRLESLHLDDSWRVRAILSETYDSDYQRFLYQSKTRPASAAPTPVPTPDTSKYPYTLRGARLTPDALTALNAQGSLRELSLAGRNIGDDSLNAFLRMKGLRYLDISFTGLSEAAVRRLILQLPDCVVAHSYQGLDTTPATTSLRRPIGF